MFGKKKKQPSPQSIRIKGESGVLYDGLITAMNVPEALVIELSIEFFDDPEPCQIHRGAVLRRVFMEIGTELGEGNETQFGALSPEIRRYMVGYDGVQSIEVYRAEES